MSTELRATGISVLGDMPWGAHFCYFYETKQDLLDTLVPYFQAGLENGEFCLWVVFEPLTVEEARAALRQAVPELDRLLENRSLEIRLHHQRFFQSQVPEADGIVPYLRETLRQALARGHSGMRLAGSSARLQKKDEWRFCEFEGEIERAVTNQRIIALCAFPLASSGAAEIFDAARTHQFALARRQGDWQVLETPDEKRARSEIAKINLELEQRVAERTRALEAANQELRREIEDRKQAEQELRQQKEILQTIFDHVPMMINFVGPDRQLLLVNREWERTLGWTREEIRDNHVDILAENYPDPDYRREVEKFCWTTSAEWADFKTKVRDGRVIDTSWSMLHLSDGTSIGIGQDITRRKRAEDSLRESEARFRQLAENIREIFWITSADFQQVLYLSPAFESITGRTPESLYASGLPALLEIVHPEDRPGVIEIVERGEVAEFDIEFRLIRPDGSVRWLRDRGFPVRDGSGAIVRTAGVAEDITLRQQAEESLRATTEQMRALSANLQSARERESTHIARRIHDELGSTLTSLRWELEGMDKVLKDSAGRPQLAVLTEKLEIMFRLADATIDSVRRIASELRPSILDDIGLAAAIEWQAQQFQARTGILCYCDFSVENPLLNAEQSTAAFRIFQEALTNILRHAHASEVHIALDEPDGVLVLTIRDNGRGITELEKTGRQSLGLLGMRERAHLVGASIDFAGVAGNGTAVTVRMPIEEAVAAALP